MMLTEHIYELCLMGMEEIAKLQKLKTTWNFQG